MKHRRYIDAIEAEAAIKDLFADMPRIEFMGNRRRWREENEQYLRCLDVLRSLPTADVRENVHATFVSKIVKKADWKGQMQSYYQPNSCSNCIAVLTGEENYCPNCGAQLGEGRK